MSNSQTHYHFKLDFQAYRRQVVNPQRNIPHKQLQSMELPEEYPSRKFNHDIKVP